MEIVHRLQQSTGTGIRTGASSSTCTGAGAQDMDYRLIANGLVRFKERIYVPDNNELKKVILREFHMKPYSSHPGYQKTLTAMK